MSGPIDFAADAPIPAIETHAFAYRLPTVMSPSEYFLIENREPIDFDAALPAHGLLIWHVDDSRPNNTDDAHRLLDLEEMDEGVNGDRPTDAGDPWHDTAVGETALVNVSFPATALGRYLIDAAASIPGDAIASDDERIVHVSTNAFAFRDDMEAGNGNWTVSGAPDDNPEWSLLNASAANGSAHRGSFAWRFGYASNTTLTPANPAWRALTSATINVTGSAYLIFYHRFDFSNATDSGAPGNSRTTVEVRYGAGPWAVLATYSGRSLQWEGVSIPLAPPVLPTTMQLRFNATAGDMPGRGGWWIDDVAIAARGLTHAVVLLPPSIAADAIAGTFASARLKVANVGDFEDSFLVNASVPVGSVALFAPPGGLPTLASRSVVVGPDRHAGVYIAILVAPLSDTASYYD